MDSQIGKALASHSISKIADQLSNFDLRDLLLSLDTLRPSVNLIRWFFPEIREVGLSLDSTPDLRPTLRHFAVAPLGFRPRPPRIDRSRLETANGALKPGIGLDQGKPISRMYRAWGAQNPAPIAWVTWQTWGFARFCVVFRGFRRRLYGTNGRSRRETVNGASKPAIAPREIPTVPSDLGVLDTLHLVMRFGAGRGHDGSGQAVTTFG